MNSEIIEMLGFSMDKRPDWVADDEIYIDAPGGFESVSSQRKYPDKKPGMLLREIQNKIDELNEMINQPSEKNEALTNKNPTK